LQPKGLPGTARRWRRSAALGGLEANQGNRFGRLPPGHRARSRRRPPRPRSRVLRLKRRHRTHLGRRGSRDCQPSGTVTPEDCDAIDGKDGATDPRRGTRLVHTTRPVTELVISAQKSVAELWASLVLAAPRTLSAGLAPLGTVACRRPARARPRTRRPWDLVATYWQVRLGRPARSAVVRVRSRHDE
jgi:hypothetical protein